jgi:hypothetical protein
MHAQRSPLKAAILLALSAAAAASLTACGGPSAPAPEASPPAAAAAPAAAEVPAATATEQDAAAATAAREAELKAKEVEMQLRELAVADREAAAAAAASAAAAKKTATARPATPPKPVASAPAPAPAVAPPPPPVTVPAGTQVPVRLNSGYSTKTAALGQAVNAELASDLVVDGRVVARAGAPISGTITEVTSGSHKIGAVPALKIDFTQLVAADGRTLPVAIRINQKGESEKGRDTAKIVGGTAAGAIIGHQINDDKGKVIGGIIGGAAGAVGAQKTGTEVEIAAGTVLAANVRTTFTYDGR